MYELSGQRYPSSFPFVTMVLIGVVGLLISAKFFVENVESKKWPTTQASLRPEPAGTAGSRDLYYDYSIGGSTHTTKVFHVGSNTELDQFVTVAVDPLKYDHAVVRVDNMPVVLMCMAVSAGFIIFGMCMFASGETVNMGSNWNY